MNKTGEFRYKSRSTDESVSLEMLNCTKKDRFMKGEKFVAIISEAASSRISLLADQQVKNRKRRVHMMLACCLLGCAGLAMYCSTGHWVSQEFVRAMATPKLSAFGYLKNKCIEKNLHFRI